MAAASLLVFLGLLSAPPAANAQIPFVGCPADGQGGPVPAPETSAVSPRVKPQIAGLPAYYSSQQKIGALAPRDWHCLGVYGSSGTELRVIPEADFPTAIFTGKRDRIGPGVGVAHISGGTSGRNQVADVAARVFPAYKPFAISVARMFERPLSDLTFHPYPADKLTYRSSSLVEFQTPAGRNGLGTRFWLQPNDLPIDGAAAMIGPLDEPDLVILTIRLPASQRSLVPAIVEQFEREVRLLAHPR